MRKKERKKKSLDGRDSVIQYRQKKNNKKIYDD
jgi:hypothetical protein